jgi:hypothetical protein
MDMSEDETHSHPGHGPASTAMRAHSEGAPRGAAAPFATQPAADPHRETPPTDHEGSPTGAASAAYRVSSLPAQRDGGRRRRRLTTAGLSRLLRERRVLPEELDPLNWGLDRIDQVRVSSHLGRGERRRAGQRGSRAAQSLPGSDAVAIGACGDLGRSLFIPNSTCDMFLKRARHRWGCLLRAGHAAHGRTVPLQLRGYAAEGARRTGAARPASADSAHLCAIPRLAIPPDWSHTMSWTRAGTGVNVYVLDSGIRGSHVQFQTLVEPLSGPVAAAATPAGIAFAGVAGADVASANTAGSDATTGGSVGAAGSAKGTVWRTHAVSRVTPGFSALGAGWAADSDCFGHGTHVAALLGGVLSGVAKNVTLVPVQASGGRGLQCAARGVQAAAWAVVAGNSRGRYCWAVVGGCGGALLLQRAAARAACGHRCSTARATRTSLHCWR